MTAIVVKPISYTKVPDQSPKTADLRPIGGSFADASFSTLIENSVREVFDIEKGTESSWGRNTRETGMFFQVRGYIAMVDLTQCEVVVASNRNHPLTSVRINTEQPGPKNPADYSNVSEADRKDPNHPMNDPANPQPGAPLPQRMVTTADWALFNRLALATNANFFYIPKGYPNIDQQMWTQTIGLSRSEGITDADRTLPRLTHDQRKQRKKSYDDACLLFNRSGIASIHDANDLYGTMTENDMILRTLNESEYPNGIAGSWLLKDGALPGSTIPIGRGTRTIFEEWPLIPEEDAHHARTAIGLLEEGRKLLIMQFEKQVRMPTIATYNVAQILNTDERGHSKATFKKLGAFIRDIANSSTISTEFYNFLGKQFEQLWPSVSTQTLQIEELSNLKDQEGKPVYSDEVLNNLRKSITDPSKMWPHILAADALVTKVDKDPVDIDGETYFKAIIKPNDPSTQFAFEFVPYKIVDVWSEQKNLASVFSTNNAGMQVSGYVVRLLNPVKASVGVETIVNEDGKKVTKGKTTVNDDGITVTSDKGVDLSVGVTLNQLQQLFIRLNVKNAINLDGSGSSAIVYSPDLISGDPNNPSPRYIVSAFADWDQAKGRGTDIGNVNILRPRRSGNHIGFRIRPTSSRGSRPRRKTM